MTRLEKFVLVLLLLGLAGCKVGWLIERAAPDAIRDGRGYFEELRQKQVEKIVQSFDPGADKDQLRSDLGRVISLIPQQEPISVETLGASVECKGSGVSTKFVALEYKYPDRWVLFQVTVSNRSGHYAVTDLTVTPESIPLESISQFTLRGKGWSHYAILFMALLSFGIFVDALVLCIRTPLQRRKWPWIVLTILGIGKFGIEWSSGEFWYKIMYLSILPAGWGYEPAGPFMYASFPAGALLFLLFRSRLRKTAAAAPPINTATTTPIEEQIEGDIGQ